MVARCQPRKVAGISQGVVCVMSTKGLLNFDVGQSCCPVGDLLLRFHSQCINDGSTEFDAELQINLMEFSLRSSPFKNYFFIYH